MYWRASHHSRGIWPAFLNSCIPTKDDVRFAAGTTAIRTARGQQFLLHLTPFLRGPGWAMLSDLPLSHNPFSETGLRSRVCDLPELGRGSRTTGLNVSDPTMSDQKLLLPAEVGRVSHPTPELELKRT
jgi:hypothetical protein